MRVDRPTTRRLTPGSRPVTPRRAFTLIEMIVVIAIIAILLGIVVIGFKHVASGNQKRQTQTLLERLKNITGNAYANKATASRLFQSQIPTIYSNTTSALATGAPYANAEIWDGVPAAADDSLFKTGLLLKTILVDPEAKRIFDDLPSERKHEFYFQNSNGQRVAAPTPGSTTTFTLPLDAWGNPILFVFDNWRDPVSAATDKPHLSATNTTGTPATPSPTGGLTDLYSESTKTYWQFGTRPTVEDPNYPTKYVLPMATPAYTKFADSFRSPDNRPFWASAGPDGNYATHDDNVYSFEN